MPEYLIEPGSELDNALDDVVNSHMTGAPAEPESLDLLERENPLHMATLAYRVIERQRPVEGDPALEKWYGGLKDE